MPMWLKRLTVVLIMPIWVLAVCVTVLLTLLGISWIATGNGTRFIEAVTEDAILCVDTWLDPGKE